MALQSAIWPFIPNETRSLAIAGALIARGNDLEQRRQFTLFHSPGGLRQIKLIGIATRAQLNSWRTGVLYLQ